MESKGPNDTLRIRRGDLNLLILFMLESNFSHDEPLMVFIKNGNQYNAGSLTELLSLNVY